MSRLVLGINSAHGDSSAALASEDGLLAAIAEERINRKKHCGGFPALAVTVIGLADREITPIWLGLFALAVATALFAAATRNT